ncbi:TonB-dependent receptor [Formosa sp. 4Alg 33]|uniref:TonB-dependent receptor n=1 Tax=Formosa sp. 4Alg 33 TaxID=3382189 RepID=UPI003D9C4345
MYKQFQYILTLVAVLCSSTLMFSQEKDTIQTDVINVVKPYTPTISDAFKVKTTPTLDDNSTTEKKPINYEILSVPVASTFIPTKGTAATIEKEKPERFYDSYINLGLGSYGSLISELSVAKEFNRIGIFGAKIAYDKSNGEIEDVNLDSGFSDFKADFEYINRQRDKTWSIMGGLETQKYNWYGTENSNLKDIDVAHDYFDLYLSGEVEYEYTYVKSASVLLRRFYDDFDSQESHLKFTGKVDLPILDEEITTDVRFEFFSGEAGTSYNLDHTPEYGNVLLGVSPKYQLNREDFTLNIGASMYYMLGINDTESNFYVYPNITGTFRIVDDAVIAYGGFTGDVIQNTYRDFVKVNPYLSPSISVKPTDNNYNAYVGMLGKFTNDIGYNVKVGYTSEDDKSLFRKNRITTNNFEKYSYGNSFMVVYDNVTTIQALAELNVNMNKNLKIGFRAEYNNYDTTLEEEAWNLPNIKASVFGDYMSDQKWFAGANIFYVGKRNDQYITGNDINLTTETIDVDGYLDLNLNGGYNVTNSFTVFLKLNNITAQNYESWNNYDVQGFQVLGGATFKFDF